MALTKPSFLTNIITSLATTSADRGLTESAFKAKFDETVTAIKAYLNDVLTAEVDTALGLKLNITDGIGRNKIINGNFGINQRVVSGTVIKTVGLYGHDRWKAGAAGCTYTFSTTANVTTITISAGSLIQVIEGLNLQSGTHTLSWTGTAQGKIGAGSFSATGVTGSATGGTNLSIEFGTGTLSKVQFEKGSIATTFEDRLFNLELSLCQMYYEKSYDLSTAPASNTQNGAVHIGAHIAIAGSVAGSIFTSIPFLTTKRITPTNIKIYSSDGTIDAVYNVGTGSRTGVTATNNGENRIGYLAVSNASATNIALNAGLLLHWTAESEL